MLHRFQSGLRRAITLLALTASLSPWVVQAADLPGARPEAVGLSSAALDRLKKVLQEDVDKKRLPGAVLLIARHGKVAYFDAVGMQDPVAGKPMAKDSIFRIYSMSKPVTSVAAMMLVEQGRINLDDPVSMYIPQFAAVKVGVEKTDANGNKTLDLIAPRRPITVQDLMRHASGLTYGFFGDGLVKKQYDESGLAFADLTNAEFAEKLAALPLAYQPGTTWDYSHSTDILGRVVEVASGQSLYEFEKRSILGPLGMSDTSFYVTDTAKQGRVAEPFADDRVFGLHAEFNDPRVARKPESGGGGMVSTAMDYARFLQMLLDGGSLSGQHILGSRTVAYMTSDHLGTSVVPGPYYLPGPGYGFGLGFAVRKATGESSSPGEVGEYYWGGAGGTYMWVDPRNDMLVVFMMQSPKQRLHYRSLLRDMIYAAVQK